MTRWATRLGLYLLLMVGVVVGGAAIDVRRTRRLEATWSRELGGRDFAAAYPGRGWNATANRLAELSVPLGLSYSTADHPDPAGLTDELAALAKNRDEIIRPQLDLWKQIDRGPLARPSPEVDAALDGALPALIPVQQLLLDSPAPFWDRTVDDPDGKKLPNLLGPLRLQRLLILQAGRLLAAGRDALAQTWLEAAWKLQQERHDDPDLVVQVLVLAELRMWHPLLRRSCIAAATYSPRLQGLEVRRQMKISILGRARHSLLRSRWKNPLNRPQHPLVRPMLPLANAMYRHSAFHLTGDVLDWERLPASRFDPQAIADREPSWWFFRGHHFEVSTYADAWLKAAHEALQLELSQLVFEERRGAPAWSRRASALRGIQWQRVVRGDFATFEANPGLVAIPAKGQPTRFAVHVADRCLPADLEYHAPLAR